MAQQWTTCLHCGRYRRHRFDPWVRKIPWRKEWQPTPVFLPGKSHGQRSLAGYSPWSLTESDMTEWTHWTQFIYSVVLVSALQQSESVICIYIYIYTHTHTYTHTYIDTHYFFSFLSIVIITEHWVEFPVLYNRPLLIVCFIYSSVYMSISIF